MDYTETLAALMTHAGKLVQVRVWAHGGRGGYSFVTLQGPLSSGWDMEAMSVNLGEDAAGAAIFRVGRGNVGAVALHADEFEEGTRLANGGVRVLSDGMVIEVTELPPQP